MAATNTSQDIWLLITAHPDDESMFFLPTLRSLRKDPNIIKRHILCLSTGDYPPSDGTLRTHELNMACDRIGWDCTVIDHKSLKDGPNEVWDGELIAQQVLNCIIQELTSDDGFDDDDDMPIDRNLNVLTFDDRGVSSHPNHIDTFKGVRYFFHEKAKHSTRTEENDIISRLTVPRGKKKVQMTIQMWTLNTISNPLQKYFFWIVWDLLPQLLLFLLQSICRLVLFLLGSSLWSKSKKLSTSALTTGKSRQAETTMTYRMMEPILVWQAMAAHYSQFVWYRRLSVLFSRYTYMNDLIQVVPEDSYLFYHPEEDDISLPPISILQEDSNFLLNTKQMNVIRQEILPPSLQLRPWKRIYSASRDGDSFITFQKMVGDYYNNKSQQCALLVVKTTRGEVIGGYASVPFVPTKGSPAGGASGSCLFKIQDSNVVVVYGKNNRGNDITNKRVVLDATRRLIAFGGGASEGVNDGFGLSLNDGFLRGTTARCQAFDNEPLVDGDVFEVMDVEVWGFLFGQL